MATRAYISFCKETVNFPVPSPPDNNCENRNNDFCDPLQLSIFHKDFFLGAPGKKAAAFQWFGLWVYSCHVFPRAIASYRCLAGSNRSSSIPEKPQCCLGSIGQVSEPFLLISIGGSHSKHKSTKDGGSLFGDVCPSAMGSGEALYPSICGFESNQVSKDQPLGHFLEV